MGTSCSYLNDTSALLPQLPLRRGGQLLAPFMQQGEKFAARPRLETRIVESHGIHDRRLAVGVLREHGSRNERDQGQDKPK
jgi:hypothetical protein